MAGQKVVAEGSREPEDRGGRCLGSGDRIDFALVQQSCERQGFPSDGLQRLAEQRPSVVAGANAEQWRSIEAHEVRTAGALRESDLFVVTVERFRTEEPPSMP